MKGSMLAIILEQTQIQRCVVAWVPINMVNHFGGPQVTAKNRFHDKRVLCNIATIVSPVMERSLYLGVPIFVEVSTTFPVGTLDAALFKASALVRAESCATPDVQEITSAVFTDKSMHSNEKDSPS